MSELLNRLEIFSKINEEIKHKIEIFHVFNDYSGEKSVLFITSDDKVFGFGSNTYGCCGLGHNSVVNEPQIIPELCHKNIQQFFNGGSLIGLSSDKKAYGWGRNDYGQLGQGFNSRLFSSKAYYKPENINFSSEKVIQLSCGAYHCLALTENGRVYGWGSNKYGEIGCGEGKGDIITSPLHLDIFPQFSVKSIHCFEWQSYALTTDGLVYSWGSNELYSLGHDLDAIACVFVPKLILNIPKIISVCHRTNTYFLTTEKQLYFCGHFNFMNNERSIQKLPKLLKSELQFTSLYSLNNSYNFSKSVSVCDKKVFELYGNECKETEYKYFFDYYSQEMQITYKTIHIKSDQIFDGNDLKHLQNYIKVFDKCFVSCEKFGSGAFGEVFKVKDKLYLDYYAVKKIFLNGKNSIFFVCQL